jgi:geranylgeranylglycerol-phosphate geranylgeranyltransferase
VTDVARLVRLPNLVIAAAGVLAGAWIALARIAVPPAVVLAALCGAALGAYGFIRNDIADATADAVSHPDRPIPSGRIHPQTADGYARWAMLAAMAALLLALRAGASPIGMIPCFLAAWAVMDGYSPGLKRLGFGNLAVAVVAGLPLFFGAVAVNRPREGLVPWAIAAWIHLLRELVKDLEDQPGDQAVRRRTLPILIGRSRAAKLAAAIALAFVPVSLVLPYRAQYGGAYFAVALAPQLAVLVAAARLVVGRFERVSALLKGAMVAGLIALVAGRVT